MDHGRGYSLGYVMLSAGLLLVLIGGLMLLASRMGIPLGRLPGDIALRGKHFTVYAPVATCLLLSLILSAVVWLLNHLRR